MKQDMIDIYAEALQTVAKIAPIVAIGAILLLMIVFISIVLSKL